MIYTYNLIWDNDNTTKIRTNKLLTSEVIKEAFERLSKRKIKEVQKIDILNSYAVNEAEKKNLIFTYTFYEGEQPYCYYRNFIPDYNYEFNDTQFIEAFRNLKTVIWGQDSKINNASPTR